MLLSLVMTVGDAGNASWCASEGQRNALHSYALRIFGRVQLSSKDSGYEEISRCAGLHHRTAASLGRDICSWFKGWGRPIYQPGAEGRQAALKQSTPRCA